MYNFRCTWKAFHIKNRHVIFFMCIFFFAMLVQQGYASAKENIVELNYFYISVCASCHDTEEYLAELSDRTYPIFKEKNKVLRIYRSNTAENENLNRLQKFFEAYNVPEKDRILPIVFFGKSYIAGGEEIKLRLEKELPEADPGSLVQKDAVNGENAVLEDFNAFKAATTFAIGFANGLTPCSLSMLLFFISLLLARNVNIIKMGLLYCTGKFIAYFFLGTLLFGSLGNIRADWLDYAVKVVMLAAVLIFVCLNAMDFLAAKNEKYESIRLQLPVKLRGMNHKWIKVVSGIDNPTTLAWFSFLLGIATSAGEFLCTGQIYLTTILYALHSQKDLTLKAMFYFLEYSFAFITPLLLITFIVHKGKGLFDVSEFIRRNMHIIKLINIVLFLALGVFLILNF